MKKIKNMHQVCSRKLIITPLSPWITPLQADTVFGHLCWAIRGKSGKKGPKKVDEFLLEMEESPIFTLSDAMPEKELFRPLHPFENAIYESHNKEDMAKEMDSVRQHGATIFISEDRARNYAGLDQNAIKSFRNAQGARKYSEHFKEHTMWKNFVDRDSGMVQENGLYPLRCVETCTDDKGCYKKMQILVNVFDKDKYNDYSIENLLSEVFQTGYGKKKSQGYGAFGDVVWEDSNITFLPEDDASAGNNKRFVVLSGFLPSKEDSLSDARYKTFVKYGKLGEERALGANFRKKPLIVVKPGATFQINNNTFNGYVGRMVSGISSFKNNNSARPASSTAPIMQYGYGFCLVL